MMWEANRICGCLLVACSCLLYPLGRARAQDEPAQAPAEQLFQDAVVLMKADHCQDAVPRFLESQHLDPSAATLLNLATCYARMGKSATAWRVYRQAAESAVLEGNRDIQARADKAIGKLEPTLTRLRVVAPAGPNALTIKVNGEPVSGDRIEVPLDPGENFIEAVAPGHEPWRRTVNAQRQGAMIVVEVPDLGATQRPSESAPPRPRQVPPRPRPVDLRPAAIVAGGVGVTGIALGVIMGLGAKRAYDDSRSHCFAQHCNQAGHDLRETAHDRAGVATWATVIGVGALGTGAVLWLVSDDSGEGVGVAPWLGAGSTAVGVAMEGRL
jgi:hypothetical protein